MWTAWKICFVIVVLLARFFKGYTIALPGSTLLYLVMLVHSSVEIVSTTWVAKSIAGILGALTVGYLFQTTDWNQLYIMGFLLAMKSLVYFCIPLMTQLWQLMIVMSVTGFVADYVVIGLQTYILKIWGPIRSRPLIYLTYIAWGIGGGAAPFIAQIFLVMAYGQAGSMSSCPSSSSTTNSTLVLDDTFHSEAEKIMNPVGWTYIISGIGLFLSAISVNILGLTKGKNDMVEGNEFAEKREEERFRDIWWLLLPFVLSYSFVLSYRYTFQTFIYSICVCSELNFSKSDAANITSLYGLGIIIGGIAGSLVGIRVSPQNINLISITCAIIVMVFFITFGRSWSWLAWIASFLNGFFTGPLNATVTTWLSQVTNITGKFMSVNICIGMIAYSVFFPLGGVIFQQSPFGVLYLFLALACANAACIVAAACCVKRHKKIRNATEESQLLPE